MGFSYVILIVGSKLATTEALAKCEYLGTSKSLLIEILYYLGIYKVLYPWGWWDILPPHFSF